MSNRSCHTAHSTAVETTAGGVNALCLRGQQLTVEEVYAVAARSATVTITDDPTILQGLRDAEALVRKAVDSGEKIYGLTTGFGSMANLPVCAGDAEASQTNLLEFLASGTGKPVDRVHVRAAMVLRANMLLRGASGVRLEIVERLVRFLNEDATPLVGELGSIGASGDLVPLATIARAITGQAASCRVRIGEKEVDRDEALRSFGLEPLPLVPKEALAIVNGTSFSAAIGLNCIHAAKGFLGLSLATHSMMAKALLGHEDPFAAFVHQCKPHPGQVWTAEIMRKLLSIGEEGGSEDQKRDHLQDRYSLRCLPQYMGPIVEGVLRAERVIETEMNAITDNPLIDTETEQFFQSGNFLGQYIGIAMDDLRKYIGLLAKHLDVQIALLVSPEFNHGLPPSLMGTGDSPINMNLKGLQITGNSIMPMLTHLGNPLVEHFPTHAEQFNQNVNGLSWGAAHLASQSVDLYNHYASVALIFAVQAIDLRKAAVEEGNFDGRSLLNSSVVPLYDAVYEAAERTPGSKAPLVGNGADKTLEETLGALASSIGEDGAVIEAVSEIVDSLSKVELVG